MNRLIISLIVSLIFTLNVNANEDYERAENIFNGGNEKEAYKYYLKASKAGYNEATCKLGEYGRIGTINKKVAGNYIIQAIKNKSINCKVEYANIVMAGESSDYGFFNSKDEEINTYVEIRALQYWKLGADQGHPGAIKMLSFMANRTKSYASIIEMMDADGMMDKLDILFLKIPL